MGDHGAGSSAGGPPAGAVVVLMPVDVEAAVPAAPPAGAAAGARRRPSTLWTTWVSKCVTWWVGAAAPRGRPPPPAWTRLSKRVALAAVLLGYTAAALAFVAMVIVPLTGKVCVRTDAEVASLRTASERLLLVATAQMLAGTTGLLAPLWPPVAVFGTLQLGVFTSFHASEVLLMLLATCHGSAHSAVSLR